MFGFCGLALFAFRCFGIWTSLASGPSGLGLDRSVVFLRGALRFHLRLQDKMEEFLAPANDM